MRVGQALGVNFKRATPTPAFTMPSGMRLRYDRPSHRLQPYVTGYAIYINEHRKPMSNWFLPSPAMITVLLDAGRVTASIRNRTYDAVPAAALWGPASHAPHTITRGGIMVGVGLTALGWARLTARPADLYANTVSPVSDVIGSENAGDLVAALDGLDTDAGFAPTLNRALPALLQREMPPQHALVEALERMIVSDGVIGVSEVAILPGEASTVGFDVVGVILAIAMGLLVGSVVSRALRALVGRLRRGRGEAAPAGR